MRGITRALKFLRDNFLSEPHLAIALIAVSFVALWDFLYATHSLPEIINKKPSEHVFLLVITLVLITILAHSIREAKHAKAETEKNDDRFERLVNSARFNIPASLRSRPSIPEDYSQLWGGFTGQYYVYNPSYKVDKNVDIEKIVKIFISRYQNSYFTNARYIFLTKDECGKEDLNTFCKLMQRVKEECPEVFDKIEVKEICNRSAAREPEMYLGSRDGKMTGIMEVKEVFSDTTHGMPNYYLIVDDAAVIKNYIKCNFEPAWNSEHAKDIDVFKHKVT